MRTLTQFLILWPWTLAIAQYDVGISAGAMNYTLEPRSSKDHSSASFSDIDRPALMASVFYRERCGNYVDLGVELQFTRKAFHAYAYEGSLGGGKGFDTDVDLYLMHLNLTPEVRMGPSGTAVVRFGPQVGFKLGGSMTGRSWYSHSGQASEELFTNARPDAFKGDLRFLFGLGFRTSANALLAVSIDPFLSAAIGSLVKEGAGSRGLEWGLKMGLSLRRPGTPVTRWIDQRMPTPPPGPHW